MCFKYRCVDSTGIDRQSAATQLNVGCVDDQTIDVDDQLDGHVDEDGDAQVAMDAGPVTAEISAAKQKDSRGLVHLDASSLVLKTKS